MSSFLSSATLSTSMASTSQSTAAVVSVISSNEAVSICVETQQYIQKTFQPSVAAFANQIEALFAHVITHFPSPDETSSIRQLAQQVTLASLHCMSLIAPLHTKEFQEVHAVWKVQCKKTLQAAQKALATGEITIKYLKRAIVFASSADLYILARVHLYSQLHKEWTEVTNKAILQFSTEEQNCVHVHGTDET